jgi:hypothetical protein
MKKNGRTSYRQYYHRIGIRLIGRMLTAPRIEVTMLETAPYYIRTSPAGNPTSPTWNPTSPAWSHTSPAFIRAYVFNATIQDPLDRPVPEVLPSSFEERDRFQNVWGVFSRFAMGSASAEEDARETSLLLAALKDLHAQGRCFVPEPMYASLPWGYHVVNVIRRPPAPSPEDDFE